MLANAGTALLGVGFLLMLGGLGLLIASRNYRGTPKREKLRHHGFETAIWGFAVIVVAFVVLHFATENAKTEMANYVAPVDAIPTSSDGGNHG